MRFLLTQRVIGSDWKQSNVAGPLDSFCDFSLMCCTVAGDPAWYNLAALSNEEAQSARLLVVDGKIFLRTESAYFTALKRPSFAWAAGAARAAAGWALAGAACRTLI
jgi:hypothetical protein